MMNGLVKVCLRCFGALTLSTKTFIKHRESKLKSARIPPVQLSSERIRDFRRLFNLDRLAVHIENTKDAFVCVKDSISYRNMLPLRGLWYKGLKLRTGPLRCTDYLSDLRKSHFSFIYLPRLIIFSQKSSNLKYTIWPDVCGLMRRSQICDDHVSTNLW